MLKRSAFCDAGDAAPRRGNRFSRWVGRLVLQRLGWCFEGRIPDLNKCVIIVAPHTSNWDFLIGISAMFALGIRVRFLGKHTLFRWPLRNVMGWLGGIPVDRAVRGGVVEQTVQMFRSAEALLLGMSPEGTRKRVTRWKTGFYYIAKGAGVPIVPVSLGYRRRVVSIGRPFTPTADMAADLQALEAFFVSSVGKRPLFGRLSGGEQVGEPP